MENVIVGQLKLPAGPIFMSPSSLLASLHREVILKKPELFKIDCLNSIISTFPPETKPLIAGFANKVNVGYLIIFRIIWRIIVWEYRKIRFLSLIIKFVILILFRDKSNIHIIQIFFLRIFVV